jgi:hypothetical protein
MEEEVAYAFVVTEPEVHLSGGSDSDLHGSLLLEGSQTLDMMVDASPPDDLSSVVNDS